MATDLPLQIFIEAKGCDSAGRGPDMDTSWQTRGNHASNGTIDGRVMTPFTARSDGRQVAVKILPSAYVHNPERPFPLKGVIEPPSVPTSSTVSLNALRFEMDARIAAVWSAIDFFF